jgi:hypothetical protein
MITLYSPYKVYVVIDAAPDGGEVLAVFANRALAKKFVNNAKAKNEFLSQYLEIRNMPLKTKL